MLPRLRTSAFRSRNASLTSTARLTSNRQISTSGHPRPSIKKVGSEWLQSEPCLRSALSLSAFSQWLLGLPPFVWPLTFAWIFVPISGIIFGLHKITAHEGEYRIHNSRARSATRPKDPWEN